MDIFVKVLLHRHISIDRISSLFYRLRRYHVISIFIWFIVELQTLVYSRIHCSAVYFLYIYVLTVTEKLLSLVFSCDVSCFTNHSISLTCLQSSVRMHRYQWVLILKWALVVHVLILRRTLPTNIHSTLLFL